MSFEDAQCAWDNASHPDWDVPDIEYPLALEIVGEESAYEILGLVEELVSGNKDALEELKRVFKAAYALGLERIEKYRRQAREDSMDDGT